jgi:hypothetical protein
VRNIPPLYHWSPTTNRDSIRRDGLTPTCPHHGVLTVCFGTSPAEAWALSGAHRPELGPYDLWQANVADTPVYRSRHWGRFVEYRIPRSIHPRGLFLVAARGVDL